MSDDVPDEMVKFLRECQRSHGTSEGLEGASLMELLRVYEHPLVKSAATEHAVMGLEAIVDLLQTNREAVASWCGERLLLLRKWIFHTSNNVRVPCAQLMATAITALDPSQTIWLMQELHNTISGNLAHKAKFEETCGSIQLIGEQSGSGIEKIVLVQCRLHDVSLSESRDTVQVG